jgi:hypothetical protein
MNNWHERANPDQVGYPNEKEVDEMEINEIKEGIRQQAARIEKMKEKLKQLELERRVLQNVLKEIETIEAERNELL